MATAMAAEDEVIKKRLLMDGEGDGDDRRLNRLLRTFLRFCSLNSPDDEAERASLYQKLCITISQCEFAMSKMQLIHDMNCREMLNYERALADIESKISAAHQQIADSHEELQNARQIRKNRETYNALVKIIQKHPARQETTSQLEALEKELKALNEAKESLQSKLMLRRKQFHLLMLSIVELQGVLNDDKDVSMATT